MRNWLLGLDLAVAASIGAMSFVATANAAEPSYMASPDVYKVIFENDDFRVIEANRKKGVADRQHSHLLPSVIYWVTDCTDKISAADGKITESSVKAGTARAIPIIASHSAENVGAADCKQVIVEKNR